jgi:hypothetical protein
MKNNNVRTATIYAVIKYKVMNEALRVCKILVAV